MKLFIVSIVLLLMPFSGFADDQEVPTISTTCQFRSLPDGKDGATIEYSWKITATPRADRVLSVDHLTRDPKLGARGVTRHFEYCKAGSTHQQEIIFKVGSSPDDGARACWFEGLVANASLKVPLPKAAVLSVTTRQVSSEEGKGHLIGITVSNNGREMLRHYLFINFISAADLQGLLPSDLGEGERELRDGNEWQIFTDPKTWRPTFERFTELEKEGA